MTIVTEKTKKSNLENSVDDAVKSMEWAAKKIEAQRIEIEGLKEVINAILEAKGGSIII